MFYYAEEGHVFFMVVHNAVVVNGHIMRKTSRQLKHLWQMTNQVVLHERRRNKDV
jgi:hypothetical protein